MTADRHRTYWDRMNREELLRDHPIGDAFARFVTTISRDELRARQERLFRRCVALAWRTPFYRRLWGAAGIGEGDIRSLDALPALPSFGKDEIMASLERRPPFGDFAGFEAYPPDERPPAILHTTSGTTGSPQVLLFGPKSREVQNLLLGRIYRFQGLQPEDVVHSVYGHGMVNGGHYVREALTHWTGSTLLPAGTGAETRSLQQVELMKRFGVTAIIGFADYIKKLAEVARANGIEPGRDIPVRMISGHLGRADKAALAEAWGGARAFDWYGVGDTGAIAGEGPDRDGLYVQEDAHLLEICDIESGRPLPDDALGDMVVTCLFKDDLCPLIRFNTHDVSRVLTGASSIGVTFRRIEGFLGRSDQMVKVRGISIFPHAISALLAEIPEFAAEFVCTATRDDTGRDGLRVAAEVHAPAGQRPALHGRFADTLRRKLGIEVEVELVDCGATAALTQIETRQKPIRLIDERE